MGNTFFLGTIEGEKSNYMDADVRFADAVHSHIMSTMCMYEYIVTCQLRQ
jgi:hypothetical protein